MFSDGQALFLPTTNMKPLIATSTVNGEIFRSAGIASVGLHGQKIPFVFFGLHPLENRGGAPLRGSTTTQLWFTHA